MDSAVRNRLNEQISRIKPRIESLAKQSRQVLFEGDDLLQEVFLAGIERDLDWSLLSDGWFIVTAQNILRTGGRRNRCWRKYFASYREELMVTNTTPCDQVQLAELRGDVRNQVRRLPPTERFEVRNRFFVRHVKNKRLKSTARTRLLRAKRKLLANRRLRSYCEVVVE